MKVNKNFEYCIGFILKHEGGYVDDPTDKGGETNYGISKRAYPSVDIKGLTLEGAKEIYKRDYWDKGHCEKLPEEIRYIHFDGCINHGISRAVKILQKASGCKYIDGLFGPETTAKSKSVSIELYALHRLYFYCEIVRRNNSQAKFIGGWKNRIKDIVKLNC